MNAEIVPHQRWYGIIERSWTHSMEKPPRFEMARVADQEYVSCIRAKETWLDGHRSYPVYVRGWTGTCARVDTTSFVCCCMLSSATRSQMTVQHSVICGMIKLTSSPGTPRYLKAQTACEVYKSRMGCWSISHMFKPTSRLALPIPR
jgi:hypothetical protein